MSKRLAQELSGCIDFVIGHQDELCDDVARQFTESFYRQLACGKYSLDECYKMASPVDMEETGKYFLFAPKADPAKCFIVRGPHHAAAAELTTPQAAARRVQGRKTTAMLCNETPSDPCQHSVATVQSTPRHASPAPFVVVGWSASTRQGASVSDLVSDWAAYNDAEKHKTSVLLWGRWFGEAGCGDKVIETMPSILHVDTEGGQDGGMVFQDGSISYSQLRDTLKCVLDDGQEDGRGRR
eukprot:2447792-Rhodomonas_salina.1